VGKPVAEPATGARHPTATTLAAISRLTHSPFAAVVGFMKIGRVGSTDHENTIEKSPKGGESFNLKHRFGGRFW
jgi:hypothetical protein